MFSPIARTLVILPAGLVVLGVFADAQETKQSEREAMYYRYLEFASYVTGGSITPHWMADGSSFWYAEGVPARTVIYKVDPKANTRTPLLDTARLRRALTPVLGHEPPYQGVPFEELTFLASEKAVKFTVENNEFVLDLDSYEVTRAPALSDEEKDRTSPRVARDDGALSFGLGLMEILSPDGRWFASLKDHNLWLRSTSDGRGFQLTTDGEEDFEWGGRSWMGPWAVWSPDSFKVAVAKINYRNVPRIPIVHSLRLLEEDVEWIRYPKAGGPTFRTELFVVDVLTKRQMRIDLADDQMSQLCILGWRPDGSELLFIAVDRWYKTVKLMAFNPVTGGTRVVLTEISKAWLDPQPELFTPIDNGNGFIWVSERDGWQGLYLYNIDGMLVRRLTEKAYPVLRVVAVDETAGWVYFSAHGDPDRPHNIHLYRVHLDGRTPVRLTEAAGSHDSTGFIDSSRIQFSPSKQFFVDTYSSAARPPTVELRRADGALLATVSRANFDPLKELKWSPPEEFVLKTADGRIEAFGVLYKPYDFDATKKYPVIDFIYPVAPSLAMGNTFVPRTFTARRYGDAEAIAQLGFIGVIMSGREALPGGKESLYGNIGRYEIPDHVAALRRLAEQRPYLDLSRVGIFGYSWGGYTAVRGMLMAPAFYSVGVAIAPITDMAEHTNTLIGPLEDNKAAYDYASNLRLASNLRGKLLLIHGTGDTAVPISHTMKMVEALIRAGKPYDLIVMPDQNHGFTGASERYRLEATRRYFQEHLRPDQVVP